jgi:uncharacterized protein
MRIVLDTNCFLAIIPRTSRFRPIFDAYRQGKIEFVVSTEILNEYAEIFAQQMNAEISENLIELILKQPNTIQTTVFYHWGLINVDYDDNKFVDSAISSNADFIVTQDKHFNLLRNIPFPPIKVINLEKLLKIIFA